MHRTPPQLWRMLPVLLVPVVLLLHSRSFPSLLAHRHAPPSSARLPSPALSSLTAPGGRRLHITAAATAPVTTETATKTKSKLTSSSSSSSPITGLRRSVPPQDDNLRCAILTCGNRHLRFAQNFSHPFFYRVHRGLSHEVLSQKLPAAWCRASHLRQLYQDNVRCAMYVDDDIFLNLDRLSRKIVQERRRDDDLGKIIVITRSGFGRKSNINAGLVIFSDLQTEYAASVVNEWYSAMSERQFRFGMKDQEALNQIVRCGDEGVRCVHWRQRRQLGLLQHCFSMLNKKSPGGKERCMRKYKRLVRKWDAEPLK